MVNCPSSQLSDRGLEFKDEVLQILDEKTKTNYSRSEEERKKDGRGRPKKDIEKTKTKTLED